MSFVYQSSLYHEQQIAQLKARGLEIKKSTIANIFCMKVSLDIIHRLFIFIETKVTWAGMAMCVAYPLSLQQVMQEYVPSKVPVSENFYLLNGFVWFEG